MQRNSNESKDEALESISETPPNPANPKKTFLQELKPWSGVHPTTSFVNFFIRPWPLIVYPAVIYSFISYSFSMIWGVCVLDTSASVFQLPPYNFTPGINSLIYVASLIGVGIGTYAGGALTDRFAEWRARKNNGIFEPETRLVLLIIPFFVVPVGLLMYSLPSERIPNSQVRIWRCPPASLGSSIYWFWIHLFWHGICPFNYFDL